MAGFVLAISVPLAIAAPPEILKQASETWQNNRGDVTYETVTRQAYFDNSALFYAQFDVPIPGFEPLPEKTGTTPEISDNRSDPLMKLPEGIEPGDVLYIQGKSPLALVYIGEQSFPDSDRKYPFFIYPYRTRLEKNTFPAREHVDLMKSETLEEYADRFVKTTDQERGVTWLSLRKRNKVEPLFVRDSFGGSNFTVYRHNGEEETAKNLIKNSPSLKAKTIPLEKSPIKVSFNEVKIFHYQLEAETLSEVNDIMQDDEQRMPLITAALGRIQKNYSQPNGNAINLQNQVSGEDGLFVGFSPSSSGIRVRRLRGQQEQQIIDATFISEGLILLPEWKKGTAAERDIWELTYLKLLDHEIGHAKIWNETWTHWAKSLPGKSYEQVVQSIKETSQEEQRKQIAFDEKTNHGLKSE